MIINSWTTRRDGNDCTFYISTILTHMCDKYQVTKTTKCVGWSESLECNVLEFETKKEALKYCERYCNF